MLNRVVRSSSPEFFRLCPSYNNSLTDKISEKASLICSVRPPAGRPQMAPACVWCLSSILMHHKCHQRMCGILQFWEHLLLFPSFYSRHDDIKIAATSFVNQQWLQHKRTFEANLGLYKSVCLARDSTLYLCTSGPYSILETTNPILLRSLLQSNF